MPRETTRVDRDEEMRRGAPTRAGSAGARWAGLLGGCCLLLLLAAPCAAVVAVAPRPGEGDLSSARLGTGWVVWETNRSGAFRIWIRPLDGGPARQLSPEEPERDHCCAHLSPDGQRVAYLAFPAVQRKYSPLGTLAELRWVSTDGRRHRTLAPAARHYGVHRAISWWSASELTFLDASGATISLDLASGERRLLSAPQTQRDYLLDPTGRWGASGDGTFATRDPASGTLKTALVLGGCEAWFTADGTTGFWNAGAGGPIDAVDLATSRTWTILRKADPVLPKDRAYVYFSMISRDRSLLAVGASNGEHDHFRADYDVFLIEIDPQSLLPRAKAVRVTEHPGVDRYPDVWRLAAAPGPTTAGTQPSAAGDSKATVRGVRGVRDARDAGGGSNWPSSSDALVFVWQAADQANRWAADSAVEQLELDGESWFDRSYRLTLGGGSASASAEAARRLHTSLRASNTVSLQVVLEPASTDAAAAGVVLAIGRGPRERGLLLEQRGDHIALRIRTGPTGASGGEAIPIARLSRSGPHHLAFTYSPGRFRAYLDGEPTGLGGWIGDFYRWRPGTFTLGRETAHEGPWRGVLSHLAVHASELDGDTVRADARAALASLAARPVIAAAQVEATLLARARVPTLDEISPYRQALVVEEWRLGRTLSGTAPAALFRVARWAILDGAPTAAMAVAAGQSAKLRLEPFAAQPQLEAVVVGTQGLAPPASGTPAPLWFATSLVIR